MSHKGTCLEGSGVQNQTLLLSMHSRNMTSKGILPSTSVRTSVTCKGLYWIVYLLVFVQVTACRESLVACVTEERFFTRMCSCVND